MTALAMPPAGRPGLAWPPERAVAIVARDIRHRDAVGEFCLQLADLLSAAAITAMLFAENWDPVETPAVAATSTLRARLRPADIIFFHFSTEDPALPALARLPQRKLLYYHGITPPEHFAGYDEAAAATMRAGYAQLPLAGCFDLLMSNSQASASALAEALGDRPPAGGIVICPPMIGIRPRPAATPAEDRPLLLFVGRLAPHKGVHHLLQAFAALPLREPEPALAIVGAPASPAYRDALLGLREALPLERRARVAFHHDLAPEALETLYRRAALFVTLSAHEGFCLPIVEALQHGLPVLALDGPAIAALIAEGRLASAEPGAVAASIAALLAAPARRRRLAARQRARLAALAEAADGRRVWEALQRILAFDARPV